MKAMKELINQSEKYLQLVNTKEYIEYQSKFDTLYLTILKEQKALQQLTHELKTQRSKFIKQQQTKKSSKDDLYIHLDQDNSLEKSIDNMNEEIENFNQTIHNYNFISRF